MPVEPGPAVPRIPIWPVVSVACGLVLMAFGLVLRDPLAMAVFEAIQ
jgi:hypothetical protein